MKNPVQTISGICYEKNSLLSCIKANGNIDPVTRSPFGGIESCSENLALKEFIRLYEKTRPWLYCFSENSELDFMKIEFNTSRILFNLEELR